MYVDPRPSPLRLMKPEIDEADRSVVPAILPDGGGEL